MIEVIVTRPAAQAAGWVRAPAGARPVGAVALPLIDIAPATDLAPVHAAWQRLPEFALVVFVSANAVEHFFAAAPPLAALAGPGDAPAPPGRAPPLRCAPRAWPRRHWPSRQPTVSASIRRRCGPGLPGATGRGGGCSWCAATRAATGWPRSCAAAAPTVEFVAAYRRQPPRADAAERELLASARGRAGRHLWLFSSSEAIANLRRLAPDVDWSRSSARGLAPAHRARPRARPVSAASS